MRQWQESRCSRDESYSSFRDTGKQVKGRSPWVAAPLSRLRGFVSQQISFKLKNMNHDTSLRSGYPYLSIVALMTTLFPLLWTPTRIESQPHFLRPEHLRTKASYFDTVHAGNFLHLRNRQHSLSRRSNIQ